MRRITLKQTLAATVAAIVMAGAPAFAKPVDPLDRSDVRTSSLSGITTPHQDLRGEHARDAARGVNTGAVVAKPPVYWSYDYAAGKPSPRPASAPAPKPADGGSDLWLILGIALGATGIVAGSAVAVGRRARVRVPA